MAPYRCFATTWPVSVFTSISATAPPHDCRCVPSPMPRPATTLAAAAPRGRATRRPSRSLRRGVEHAQPSLVGDVAPPELVRVDAQHVRELVDRLLGRERKREIERRAQPARLQVLDDRQL